MPIQAAVLAAGHVAMGAFTIGAHVGALAPAIRAAGYEVNFQLPNELPAAGMMVGAWRAGYLSYSDMAWGVQCLGIVPPNGRPIVSPVGQEWWRKFQRVWDASYKATLTVPTPGELLVALNRNLVNEDKARAWLRHQGMTGQVELDTMLSLRHQIPGSSDLIRYAVREGWDQATVDRFQYDDEFPQQLQYWMERQGYGQDARTPQEILQRRPPVAWPKLEWRSHWQVISPSQAYEMFFRLRPERINRFRQQFPNVQPFTLDDLREVLKISDYPVPFRERLAAVAQRPPRIRDVQAWYELGIIDGNEVEQIGRDYGYSNLDAARRRLQVEGIAQQKILNRLHVNTRTTTLAAYREGAFTRVEAARGLMAWAVIGTYRQAAWEQMNVQQQEAFATADPLVNVALDSEDNAAALARIRKAKAATRRAYLRGLTDQRGARAVLGTIGIVVEEIDALITTWDQEKFAGTLIASTANIKKWYERGIIPAMVARNYLANLGWRYAEIGALLLEWNQDIQMMMAKAAEKVARTQAQRQAALVKQIKEANRAKNQALQKLNATMSPAMAHRYYVKGIIDLSLLTQRLITFGYKDKALASALADAQIDRKDYLDKKAKAAGGGTGSNTNGKPPTGGKGETGKTPSAT